MKRERAHLFIEGRVQGVFYRAFARDAAQNLGLSGWVSNLPDGRVEAVFEGDRQEIERAIAECYKGPPASMVTNIDVRWEPPRGDLTGFDIRYY
jgi:acylphosphatase